MKTKSNANRKKSTKPIERGKYADAFKKGVEVVIATESGNRKFRVRRSADGSMVWTPRR